MKQIQSIAANLFAQMPNLNGLDPSEVDTVAANARIISTIQTLFNELLQVIH